MTPTGASHWAPSGAAALSVGRLRSPRMSWRQTGPLRAIRLSVVQSLDDCSACAPARPDTSAASAKPKLKPNLREITARRHYHQTRRAKLGFAQSRQAPAYEILGGFMHPSLALLLTAVMVLANAFFVAAEFAFVK